MPRSSDQRPDCGASIRTTHLSSPIRSAIAVTGAMPLSGLASVTDTPWAVVSGCSSPSSSWIAISTGPARPGDTLMLAIASLREEGFVGIVGGYHGCGLARSLDPGQRVRRATADALDRKRHVHLTGALERQRYRNLLAFRERCCKTDQHEMPTARLKFHHLAGFNEQASVDRNGHNALVERHFVNLDFFGGIGRGGQQTIGLRSLVLDGQITTRNLGAARRGTAPGLRDGEIARRDLSGMNRCLKDGLRWPAIIRSLPRWRGRPGQGRRCPGSKR